MMIWLMACAGPDRVDWHGEVRPALDASCTRCHDGSGQGPGDFTDLDEARTWAPFMVEAIADGRMPPPAADPGCNDYVGSEHLGLADGTLELLQAWIDEEMPEGDPEDAPDAPVVYTTELADPDLVLTLPEPYTPTFPDQGNEYRCFVLEHGQDEEFFITGMAPVVDNAAMVHHVVLFAVEEQFLPEDDDPGPGWDCIDDAFIGGDDAGSVVDGNGMVAGWGPGAVPLQFVEDAGLRITPDQRLVLQMHYYEGPELERPEDRSGYAFTVASDVRERLLMAPLGIFGFQIPSEGEFTYTDSYELPVPLRVHSLFPHMHQLGRAYEVRATGESGDRCIIAGDYDFENQLSYTLREPFQIEGGDRVHISCTWDNQTGETVGYGERTDEEMCFAFAMLSLGD